MTRRALGKRCVAPAIALFVVCASVGRASAEGAGPAGKIPTVEEIFSASQKAIASVNGYRGEFTKKERFGDEVKTERMLFKFARPFKVYLKYIDPYPGQEAIYVRGRNKNRIKVHKGSFPDLTFDLDPYGRLAMAESHQPIMTFGLERQIQIMSRLRRKAKRRKEGTYKVSDGGVLFGQPVWRIEASFSLLILLVATG